MFNVQVKVSGIQSDQSYCFIFPDQTEKFVLSVVSHINVLLGINKTVKVEKNECNGVPDLYVKLAEFKEVFPVYRMAWSPPANLFDQFDFNQNAEEVGSSVEKSIQLKKSEDQLNLDLSDDICQDNGGFSDEDSENKQTETNSRLTSSPAKILKVDLSKYPLPGGSDYICSVCNKQFPSGVFLRRHFFRHGDIGKRQFYCKSCDIWLPDREMMSSHKMEHKDRQGTNTPS